ncbi:MAG TPA: hypothetical protein VK563_00170 [Puia sp.]|nr:hypothetical protein [Puia sp.]
MKLKALIQNQNDGVKWLIIESDENDTKGYFLYYHVDDNNAYDTWHKSIDDAYDAASQQYGIRKENWQELK